MFFISIHLLYTLVIVCGSVAFGSIIAYGSATIRFIKITFGPLSTFEVAAFQSIPAFVAIFAPFFFSFIMKKLRRKIVTSIVGISGMIFWLLMLTMNKKYFWISIVIRGLLGITLAGTSFVCPVYINEISPPNMRGFYATLHPVFIILGHIIINLLGVTHKWQPPIYAAASFMAVMGFGVYFIPDSPVDFRVTKVSKELDDINDNLVPENSLGDQENGNTANSKKILNNDSSLLENSNNDNNTNNNTSNDNNNNMNNDREDASKIEKKYSLFEKSMLMSTFIAGTVMFVPQFSGIGAIMQNLAPMMSEVGLTFDAGYQASIAISAQLIACLISSVIVDRLGCRKLWTISTIGTTLCLFLYGMNIKFMWSKWLPMIFLFGYQFSFGIGLSAVSFVLIPLLYPPELKATAMALGASLSWVSASIVMFLFPYLKEWFGQFGLMMILSGTNILCVLFGIIFINEKYFFKNRTKNENNGDGFTDARRNIKKAVNEEEEESENGITNNLV